MSGKNVILNGGNKIKKLRKEFIAIIILVIAIIAIYFIGSFYYHDKFLNGTYVNGYKVSGLNVNEVNEKLATTINDYTLELKFRDGNSETLSGKDLQVKYNTDNNVKDILEKQNSFDWIHSFFTQEKHIVNNLAILDDAILNEKLASLQHLQPEAQIAPEDAKIEYVDQEFIVKNEVEGTTIDQNKLLEAIKLAFSKGDKVLDLNKENCYVAPAVRATDEKIQQNLQTVNQYAKAVITYQTKSGNVTLDGSDLIDWLSIDENGLYYHDESVFKKKATEFVSSLANKINSIGESRTFVGANNRTITVSGGNYGLRLQNSKEVSGLLEDIYANKVGVRTPITTGKEASVDNGGLGDTFVEIDLTGQHLWYHKDGQIFLESDIVSGTFTDPERKTPAGTYYLYNKERDRVLRGTKLPDGTWPYETPVSYWMPFNKGIGMHDSSSWRSKWGGTIYMYNGSHGCINLPTSVAAKLYENIEINCPVVCYY